jgi:hypothetical protein
MEGLVTIKTFTYAHELPIYQGWLEAEGIPCFTKDEYTIQINPFYSNALGGIKLQVKEEDVARAMEVLKELETPDLQMDSVDGNLPLVDEGALVLHCPVCGSEEISLQRRPSGLAFVVSFLTLGFPLPIYGRKYHCYGCGRDFKGK